jgi:hypothetical protein
LDLMDRSLIDKSKGLHVGIASSIVNSIRGLSIVVALLLVACGTEPSVEVVQTIVPSPLPSPAAPVITTATPEPVEPDATLAPEPTATPVLFGSWDVLALLKHARSEHFAVRLNDGRVLVAGGFGLAGITRTTEIYSPADNTWTESGELNIARFGGVAVTLQDGRVLVTGGNSGGDVNDLDSAEIFDPQTGMWELIAPMASKRNIHTATVLGDGRVLVAGGFDGADYPDLITDSVQLFDPETDSWETAQPMPPDLLQRDGARALHGAILLSDTQVMVVGGLGFGSGGLPDLFSSFIFDSVTGEWSEAGPMLNGRRGHATTLLTDGRIVVTGGQGPQPFAEIWDPDEDVWDGAGVNLTPRLGHSAVALPDGGLLVFGGFGAGRSNRLASVEFLRSGAGTWEEVPEMSTARDGVTATPLEDGRILVIGGENDTGALDLVEAFSTNE